mmetsp:Transcript_9420/g.16625  ORF Transcript_9420/g.16625 Transcript_9420/m.16625 type:complete len:89 (+) Transcript_9420:83-349(+)
MPTPNKKKCHYHRQTLLLCPAFSMGCPHHPTHLYSVFDLEEPTASAALQGLRYYEVILEPGEALFIPRKWWHYCRSKTVSCSVNFWWL